MRYAEATNRISGLPPLGKEGRNLVLRRIMGEISHEEFLQFALARAMKN